MSDMVKPRNLGDITAEIKIIEQQTAKAMIYGCIEIGKRLTEAKEIVGHGGWGLYLKDHVKYSQQWATNLMNLYQEYGQNQESLFESFANSKSFGNLEVTKHILLLGIPAEERAAFVQEQDVENKSVRELQAAIRERDAALREAQNQSERVEQLEKKLGGTEQELEKASAKLTMRDKEVEDLRDGARRMEQKEKAAEERVEQLEAKLREAEQAAQDAKNALKNAQEHPEIPESMMEEMRQEAAKNAAEEAAAVAAKELKEARAAAEAARKEGADLRSKLDAAQKLAGQGSAELERVKIYLQGTQEQFQNLMEALKAVKLKDPDTGEKLRTNVKSKLIEGMAKELESV